MIFRMRSCLPRLFGRLRLWSSSPSTLETRTSTSRCVDLYLSKVGPPSRLIHESSTYSLRPDPPNIVNGCFPSDSRGLEICRDGSWPGAVVALLLRHYRRNRGDPYGRAAHLRVRRPGQDNRPIPWEIGAMRCAGVQTSTKGASWLGFLNPLSKNLKWMERKPNKMGTLTKPNTERDGNYPT